MRFTGRTKHVAESPIGAYAHLLAQVPSSTPLLDMSQGAPGFPPAAVVSARIAEAASQPDGGRYTPLLGLPHLRKAFAADLSGHYGGDVGADDICITSGCNQAFCMVTSALAEPGDDIILTLPYYFNHDMWLGLDGVRATYLRAAAGVIPSVEEAEELIGERTRALVLVTPGNPTGAILDADRLEGFADLAANRGIVLIVDETYRSFVPGGVAPHRLFDRPGWRGNVVSLHSFSKDFAIPGHRVGAVVGSPELLREIAKLIDCVTICAPRLGQEAAHAGLTEGQAWRAEKVADIAAKQKRFERVMAERPGGFDLLSAGAYYGWVKHPFDDLTSDEVVRDLIVEQGILVIPGTAFGPDDDQMVRFSFANVEVDRLDELTPRLSAYAERRT
ncbi:MAG: aminotransferase [Acidimicrobiales bacterium]